MTVRNDAMLTTNAFFGKFGLLHIAMHCACAFGHDYKMAKSPKE